MPPSSSTPRLALPAMTRSQADPALPSLISDLTSPLLHSPAASSGAAAPVFSSSSLSIPAPAAAAPKPAVPTPLARAAIGACAGAAAGAFTYAAGCGLVRRCLRDAHRRGTLDPAREDQVPPIPRRRSVAGRRPHHGRRGTVTQAPGSREGGAE